MSTSSEANDASFYEMVHYIRMQPRRDAPRERRGQERHRYPGVHLVAPIVDGRLPARSQFEPIECYDLSVSGFSYFSERMAGYEALVVALGTERSVVLLKAEVIHSSAVGPNSDDGHLIGCRFTGRLDSLPEE